MSEGWHYHNLIGKPDKKKIIARERGYHGCSVVSGSMTGMNFYHAHMDLPVKSILHTGVPHYYWGAEAGESGLEFSRRRAAELEQMILAEGPDTVGAFALKPTKTGTKTGTDLFNPRKEVLSPAFFNGR